jgi:hypothetical protein
VSAPRGTIRAIAVGSEHSTRVAGDLDPSVHLLLEGVRGRRCLHRVAEPAPVSVGVANYALSQQQDSRS